MRFICELPEVEQSIIREKIINYFESIEEGLAFKCDEDGNTLIDNMMNDTISNLEELEFC